MVGAVWICRLLSVRVTPLSSRVSTATVCPSGVDSVSVSPAGLCCQCKFASEDSCRYCTAIRPSRSKALSGVAFKLAGGFASGAVAQPDRLKTAAQPQIIKNRIAYLYLLFIFGGHIQQSLIFWVRRQCLVPELPSFGLFALHPQNLPQMRRYFRIGKLAVGAA